MQLFGLMLILSSSVAAKPGFTDLLFNPVWYRSFDSTSKIIPAEGKLLFAWNFSDPEKQADSFFVGIDTLWALPQNLDSDTSRDWDLQVCPDEICMNGLKDNIHGANAPYPFGDGVFKTEHHFQFFPALSKSYTFIAPQNSLFGALMFCRSRTTGTSDTVFAFGAWNLVWDSSNPPPVRPVNGYLPKFSDFSISGDTVRYLKASGENVSKPVKAGPASKHMRVFAESDGLHIAFQALTGRVEVAVYSLSGMRLWNSGRLPPDLMELVWNPATQSASLTKAGCFLVRLFFQNGEEWEKANLLFP